MGSIPGITLRFYLSWEPLPVHHGFVYFWLWQESQFVFVRHPWKLLAILFERGNKTMRVACGVIVILVSAHALTRSVLLLIIRIANLEKGCRPSGFPSVSKLKFFTFLAQILKQSVSNQSQSTQCTQRGIREHSESTRRALRKQFESNQKAIIVFKSESHSRSLKVLRLVYCFVFRAQVWQLSCVFCNIQYDQIQN